MISGDAQTIINKNDSQSKVTPTMHILKKGGKRRDVHPRSLSPISTHVKACVAVRGGRSREASTLILWQSKK